MADGRPWAPAETPDAAGPATAPGRAGEFAALRLRAAALEAENAALRETLDAIDGTVVVYDAEQRFLFANAAYHAMFPHLPPDSVLARLRYSDILALSISAGSVADPAALVDPAAFIARRVAELDDRRITTREVHHRNADRWSQIRVRWTPSGHRVALRINITDMKRLQERVLHAQRMETIGRISGGVAHDFNNLLTVIISSLEMIKLRPTEVMRIADWTRAALTAAETGARLIRQLLTFAQRDVTQPRVLDPNPLLDEMRERLELAVGPKFRLDLALDPACGMASFDPLQFEAAVTNLVRNAAEACERLPAGEDAPAPIVIRTDRRVATGDGRDMIAVSIIDQGCGMTNEIAAQAFEPFYTTKPIGAGPGLGLSQVYGFASGAGGRAHIESHPGEGSTVTIELPRAQSAIASDR